ncbi:MAG: 2-oxoglutarate ferredoxin oxidoreductase subunit alpha, partial [Planctomycetota bacterium]|nr:2-oxoglutarate ferredoxin oxidoreductase subunit alpha [Planctomycetota bacterium]
LEKENITGNISYDADNHQAMTILRAQKVANIATIIEPLAITGPTEGELLVLSWGGTYGACITAAEKAREMGMSVSHAHLRWLNPFPANIEQILKGFRKVLIPELNMGQLRMLIRSRFLVDAIGFNKVQGKPFSISELLQEITRIVGSDVTAT